jgi:hypothetical protein
MKNAIGQKSHETVTLSTDLFINPKISSHIWRDCSFKKRRKKKYVLSGVFPGP